MVPPLEASRGVAVVLCHFFHIPPHSQYDDPIPRSRSSWYSISQHRVPRHWIRAITLLLMALTLHVPACVILWHHPFEYIDESLLGGLDWEPSPLLKAVCA